MTETPGERTAAALFSLQDRFAATPAARDRLQNPYCVSPVDAVRLVTGLAGGSIVGLEDEPEVGPTDLVAALALVPQVRADVDDLEFGLLTMARGRGAAWPQIAAALGLGSPQAAQQRAERLRLRRSTEDD